MATVYKFGLDGSFSLEELRHLTDQVSEIPNTELERYTSYEELKRRRFKGTVSITVEELPLLPKPNPEA